MFKPLTMRHVLIHVMKKDLPALTMRLADSELFNPDYREGFEHDINHIPGERYRIHYRQAVTRFEKITSHYELEPPHDIDEPWVVSEEELIELNEILGNVWEHCSELEEQQREITEAINLNRELIGTLNLFSKQMSVELATLDVCVSPANGSQNSFSDGRCYPYSQH